MNNLLGENQPTIKDKISKFREYLDYFERHYDNVQRAWKLINEKCENKGFRFMYDDFVWHSINLEVTQHDDSKLSAAEFTQYRNYFFPAENEEKDKAAFMLAWENHKCKNEHHWQNWTLLQRNNFYADAFLIMNLVDWIAMEFEFGVTAKEYYERNKDEVKFPEWAVKLMYQVFDCIYPIE